MALEKAGRDLDIDSFIKAMESLDYYHPYLDTQISYSADDHQAAETIIISVVKDGAWKELARFE